MLLTLLVRSVRRGALLFVIVAGGTVMWNVIWNGSLITLLQIDMMLLIDAALWWWTP